jgi:hypothetical protein
MPRQIYCPEKEMKNRRPPLYLILLPVYFILFLFTKNIHGLQAVDLVRPLALSLILVGIVHAVSFAILHHVGRSALLTFVLWMVFSLYGHVYGLLKTAPAPINLLGKHSILIILTLALLTLLVVMVLRTRKDLSMLNRSISIILFILTLVQLFNVVSFYMGKDYKVVTNPPAESQANRVVPLNPQNISAKPDIYYIILDTYTRDDVIRKYINLDTRPFLDELRQKGFYIATCSNSNFDFTSVSLSSSLNMNFIQNLDPRFVSANEDNAMLNDYIIHSKVRATLESIGYKTIAFATGFSFTELKDAYEYLTPPDPSLLSPNVQPFEALWFKTTALRALFDIHPPFISSWLNKLSFPHSNFVAREQYLLNTLPQLAGQAGPKFVFAHVLLPHVPLVFRADGSITTDDRYFRETFDQPTGSEYLIDGYKNQVEYINQRMLSIVDAIIKNSAQPPVIIIQGDHGLLYYDHFPILNAYYLPGNGSQKLYPAITPVNSFVVVFNQYFDAQIPLLPDNSYSSPYTRPYDFEAVAAGACPVP